MWCCEKWGLGCEAECHLGYLSKGLKCEAYLHKGHTCMVKNELELYMQTCDMASEPILNLLHASSRIKRLLE